MKGRAPTRATVVLDGAWRQALTVARSLGRAGHRVLVVRQRGSRYLERSRWVAGALDLGDRDAPEAWFARLAGAVASEAGPVLLYPIGDREIDFAAAHRERLPHGMRLVLANAGAVACAADKLAMGEVAERAGVPGIRTVVARDLDGILSGAEQLGYPCLVKGNNEAVRLDHRKAFVLEGPADARRHFADLGAVEHPLLVQTYLDVPRTNVYFFAQGGELVAAAATRILRTDMADGTGLAVEGAGAPVVGALAQHTRALVAALDYDGAGCAQFLVEPGAGRAAFLEVNARLGANFAAVYRAGLDLPRLAVERALGADVSDLLGPVDPSRSYGWFYGDVLGAVRAVARRHVGPVAGLVWLARAARTLLRVDDHVTWDRRDPWPTVSIWTQRLLPWREPPSL